MSILFRQTLAQLVCILSSRQKRRIVSKRALPQHKLLVIGVVRADMILEVNVPLAAPHALIAALADPFSRFPWVAIFL